MAISAGAMVQQWFSIGSAMFQRSNIGQILALSALRWPRHSDQWRTRSSQIAGLVMLALTLISCQLRDPIFFLLTPKLLLCEKIMCCDERIDYETRKATLAYVSLLMDIKQCLAPYLSFSLVNPPLRIHLFSLISVEEFGLNCWRNQRDGQANQCCRSPNKEPTSLKSVTLAKTNMAELLLVMLTIV